MVYHRVPLSPATWIAVWGAGLITLWSCGFTAAQPNLSYIMAYTQYPPLRDPELRRQKLPDAAQDRKVDMSAFGGMPDPYVAAVNKYTEAICSELKVEPIKRQRFYNHTQRVGDPFPYPDFVAPVADRTVVVPLVLLPRPEVVGKWVNSTPALKSGWRTAPTVRETRGSVFGRTVIFEPGPRSTEPNTLPAAPLGADIPSWDIYTPDQDGSFFRNLMKLVVAPSYQGPDNSLSDDADDLHLSEIGGGKLLGEFVTVPAHLKNDRLWWTSIQHGSEVRRFLAYSLLDGNGGKRAKRFQMTAAGPISPYVRPLTCNLHQPKTQQHDDLLLPVPLGWPSDREESATYKVNSISHEAWCLDDWFSAQPHACWVIREAKDSKPLQESFLLMPATEQSDRPVFSIAVFAETEPKQLIAELATLYQASADAALNSPETMERLNRLYEQVRDYPLTK